MENWNLNQADPFGNFESWYQEAQKHTTFEPTKMTLATVGADGMPSARVVLLKRYNENGLCFFTNYESRKARELDQQKKATLVFHWEQPFHRQIRISGLVEKTTKEESNEYFQTRSRGSQIGAWASPQSSVITDRSDLEKRVAEIEAKFPDGTEIPCPDYWGGFRVKPLTYEFWQAGEHRLHDRIRFSREDLSQPWVIERLAP